LILCVYTIRKKHLKPKRKTLFDLRFFYLSREKEKGKRGKTKKEQYTHRVNSNLPVRVLLRREKDYYFL